MAAPGTGTVVLAPPVIEDYVVDQTGLAITETSSGSSGLPSVTIQFNNPSPAQYTLGERNFLALAFDLIRPLPPGSTVTYSPALLADASLATTSFSCTDTMGNTVDCGSNHPSLSFKINPAVPGPVALAALPAMLQASRRLRRRVAQGAGA